MEKGDEKEGQSVQFNLGAAQLQVIGDLLRRASNKYLAGDIAQWFYVLRALKLQIISRIKSKERDDLLILEKKIGEYLRMMRTDDNGNANVKISNATATQVEKYQIMLMELLESRGFLVPLKQDATNVFGQYEEG